MQLKIKMQEAVECMKEDYIRSNRESIEGDDEEPAHSNNKVKDNNIKTIKHNNI